VWGRVREPFAVAEFPRDNDGGLAALSRLPMGMRILSADRAETARDAAVIIAGQVERESVAPGQPASSTRAPSGARCSSPASSAAGARSLGARRRCGSGGRSTPKVATS
jgi:hypothetical protein